MIYHVLHFKFRDDASESAVAAWIEEARAMKDVTAVCVVGQKIGDKSGYTHTYCVAYEDIPGFERYLAKPGHYELVDHFADLVESFTTDDFSDDMDPELGATLGRMLGEWIGPKPEIAARLSALQA